MNIRKTYSILLSILLSLSLALPFCCHMDVTEIFAHQQEMTAHSAHAQQPDAEDCNCGHELAKDYQKTKKVVHSQSLTLSSADELQGKESFAVSTYFLPVPFIQPGVLSGSGPPLHLLNSVFLN